ncbi:hypothetical protein D9758_010517 [Tetrapyrgos nigripes]|uniref:tyrosinase n=1 Tax=Tetrapyrgos nigripes TaxID=182062 RepID=A0A8H5FVW2_9AGAR|nr:hypothetical protein D9758_010517 [Tetrapyrgos nigripes]
MLGWIIQKLPDRAGYILKAGDVPAGGAPTVNSDGLISASLNGAGEAWCIEAAPSNGPISYIIATQDKEKKGWVAPDDPNDPNNQIRCQLLAAVEPKLLYPPNEVFDIIPFPLVTVTEAPYPPPSPPCAESERQRAPPPRLNIVTLKNDQKQWSLYIQALMTRKVDNDKMAAIKAMKAIQALNRAARDIVDRPNYKHAYDAEAWRRAAENLRSPYWDWADRSTEYLPPSEVYHSLNHPTLRITTPNGLIQVPNPLLSYRFQELFPWSIQCRFDDLPTTVRHPRPNPEDSIRAFKESVRGPAMTEDLGHELWKTLNWNNTWPKISNSGTTQGANANSLETLHNAMHNKIGGCGHMGEVPTAAFDPIFMLHHTNVDRQLSLWQALHPNVWVPGQEADQDLLPFYYRGSFHTSNSPGVKDLTQFNTTYPELIDENGEADPMELVRHKVHKLYRPMGEPYKLTEEAAIRVKVKKFQFNQSFSVFLFRLLLPDVEDWRTSDRLIGSYSEFVNSDSKSCKSCVDNRDVDTEGYITLHVQRGDYEDLKDMKEILRDVQDELKLGIQKIDGAVVALDDPKLKYLELELLIWDKLEYKHHDDDLPPSRVHESKLVQYGTDTTTTGTTTTGSTTTTVDSNHSQCVTL